MEYLDFNNHDFKKNLEPLQLPSRVPSTESKQYIYYETVGNKKNQKKLIKIFFSDKESELEKKRELLERLIEYRDTINIPELVMPEQIVRVNKQIVGFKMPFYDNNTNVITLLENKKVGLKYKIYLLKEVLNIINKMLSVYETKDNFFLCDIQSANFIKDQEDQIIRAVDMDSASLFNTIPFHSKYLSICNAIKGLNKYPLDERTDPNKLLYKPSIDTMYLQFAFMLLNTLSEQKSYTFDREIYFMYLERLSMLGVGHELIEALRSLMCDIPTIPLTSKLLDEINTKVNYSLIKR